MNPHVFSGRAAFNFKESSLTFLKPFPVPKLFENIVHDAKAVAAANLIYRD
jgi:hypothetical protein